MAYAEGFVNTADGLRLRMQTWKPEGAARAVVAMTHGHGEHSGRYGHVGQAFAGAGYAAYAYDLRGHGKSGGRRGHVPSYDALLDDLALVQQQAQGENAGRKLFLFGHSMGGQITLTYAIRRRPAVAGVVVSAPWLVLRYQAPRWKVVLGRALSGVLPTFTQPTGLDVAVPMSHDAAFLASFPDLHLTHALISARLGMEALTASADTLARAPEMTLPLLVMHGEADGAIDPAGSRSFVERAGSADKSLRLYPGLYHEICNETEREQVLRDMLDWLGQRV